MPASRPSPQLLCVSCSCIHLHKVCGRIMQRITRCIQSPSCEKPTLTWETTPPASSKEYCSQQVEPSPAGISVGACQPWGQGVLRRQEDTQEKIFWDRDHAVPPYEEAIAKVLEVARPQKQHFHFASLLLVHSPQPDQHTALKKVPPRTEPYMTWRDALHQELGIVSES